MAREKLLKRKTVPTADERAQSLFLWLRVLVPLPSVLVNPDRLLPSRACFRFTKLDKVQLVSSLGFGAFVFL